MISEQESIRIQIGRILESETFSTSPVLRQLLAFLGEKALSGEGEAIKEYTIAIEGLRKPTSYDPQRDSTVRIQVGRLRQKLAGYYRWEGNGDPVLIEVPKGRLGLRCEQRLHAPKPAINIEPESRDVPPSTEDFPEFQQKRIDSRVSARTPHTLALVAMLLATFVWATLATLALWRERSVKIVQTTWTPELTQLWGSFVDPKRPLLLAVASPLFVGLQGEGLFRDIDLDDWDDVLKSKKIATIQQALGGPALVARRYYAGFGDAEAAFVIGKLLGARQEAVYLMRSNHLTWRQLSNNNVIFIGPPRFFQEQLRSLAGNAEFTMDNNGITNLHPRANEPLFLQDQYPSIQKTGNPVETDSGKIYVLITQMPGPLGKGEVRTFSCNHDPGAVAAVQWFTNPNLAKTLVGKLKSASGSVPSAFQLVLEVQYRDSIPTEVNYVMHRELHISSVAPIESSN